MKAFLFSRLITKHLESFENNNGRVTFAHHYNPPYNVFLLSFFFFPFFSLPSFTFPRGIPKLNDGPKSTRVGPPKARWYRSWARTLEKTASNPETHPTRWAHPPPLRPTGSGSGSGSGNTWNPPCTRSGPGGPEPTEANWPDDGSSAGSVHRIQPCTTSAADYRPECSPPGGTHTKKEIPKNNQEIRNWKR